eukprot:5052291-Pleurochrysis_carterae.AAC.2
MEAVGQRQNKRACVQRDALREKAASLLRTRLRPRDRASTRARRVAAHRRRKMARSDALAHTTAGL